MKPVLVAGIGTDVGKTLVSAILVEALDADYWKPVQSGNLDQSDTDVVRSLVSREETTYYPEAYRLKEPLSPHAAAAREGVSVDIDTIYPPGTKRQLVIELAGGLMVPISDREQLIDAFIDWDPWVVLVSRHYLGSINHSLLTIDALDNLGLSLLGLVFNGEANPETEDVIVKQSGAPVIGRLAHEPHINPEMIRSYASKWQIQIPPSFPN